MTQECHMVDTMFSGEGTTPWHGLGNVVEGTPTADEAMRLSGCDWTVEKRPVFVPVEFDEEGNGTKFDLIEGKNAIVRSDKGTVLSVVSDSYQIIQNRRLYEFMEAVTDQGLEYVTAGSLREGRVVWALAKMPDNLTINGDQYASYLACCTSHDGTLAQSTFATNTRIVCNNTFTSAVFGANSIHRIRHSGNTTGKIEAARKALDVSFVENDQFAAEMVTLMDQAVTDQAFEAIVAGLHPTKKAEGWEANAEIERNKLRHLFYEAATVKAWTGTAYGAIQAVSEWELHAKAKPTEQSDLAFAFMQNRALKATTRVAKLFGKARDTGANLTDDSVLMAL